MTGGTVARPRLADGRADQGAAAGVMTAGAGVVGFSIRTDQGVGVAVGTAGCTDGDEIAVVEVGGRMQGIPGAAVAGRTVAAAGEGGPDRRADQTAIAIVTAGAGVMDCHIIGVNQRWRIKVAAIAWSGAGSTKGISGRYQTAVNRCYG